MPYIYPKILYSQIITSYEKMWQLEHFLLDIFLLHLRLLIYSWSPFCATQPMSFSSIWEFIALLQLEGACYDTFKKPKWACTASWKTNFQVLANQILRISFLEAIALRINKSKSICTRKIISNKPKYFLKQQVRIFYFSMVSFFPFNCC